MIEIINSKLKRILASIMGMITNTDEAIKEIEGNGSVIPEYKNLKHKIIYSGNGGSLSNCTIVGLSIVLSYPRYRTVSLTINGVKSDIYINDAVSLGSGYSDNAKVYVPLSIVPFHVNTFSISSYYIINIDDATVDVWYIPD